MTEADRSGFGNGSARLEAEAIFKENSASSPIVPATERESRGRFGGVFRLVPPPLIVAGLAYLAVSQAPNMTAGAKAIMASLRPAPVVHRVENPPPPVAETPPMAPKARELAPASQAVAPLAKKARRPSESTYQRRVPAAPRVVYRTRPTYRPYATPLPIPAHILMPLIGQALRLGGRF